MLFQLIFTDMVAGHIGSLWARPPALLWLILFQNLNASSSRPFCPLTSPKSLAVAPLPQSLSRRRLRFRLPARFAPHLRVAHGYAVAFGPATLIGAQAATALCACQAGHLRLTFAFGEAATGRTFASGAHWAHASLRCLRLYSSS